MVYLHSLDALCVFATPLFRPGNLSLLSHGLCGPASCLSDLAYTSRSLNFGLQLTSMFAAHRALHTGTQRQWRRIHERLQSTLCFLPKL